MSVKSCENLEKSQVKLTIEVGAEEFEKAVNKAYLQMRGKMNVPGFRPGKAPRKIIEGMYGAEVFYEEAVNIVLPDAYEAAVQEQKLEVVGYPQVELESCGKDGVVFQCTVAVYPEVTLGQYKGLAVTRHVRPVTEKTLDIEMVHQTRMHATYRPTQEPAKRGCRVLLDFAGYMDGKEIPDSRMEKVMVVLGDGKLMPAAEQAIYGHRAGETFRFDFTYPAEFRVPELSGKTAQFEINLRSVTEKHTPELTEEFAKSIGYDSLAAMRESIRAQKQKIHEEGADRAAGQRLLEMAGANIEVHIAPETLDRTADNEMKLLGERLSRSGLTVEQHCKNSHTTPEALRQRYRDEAESRVRVMLAARAIAEAEQIVVHPEEVNAEYRRLAALQETPEAEIRKVLTEDAVAAALAAKKVQRFLLDHAEVTSVTDSAEKE